MFRNIHSLAVGFLVITLALSVSALAESCQFYGTLNINGIQGQSVMVTAHDSETGEFLASGWEGISTGQYFIEIEDAEGKDLVFQVIGNPSDQQPQLCESGETTKLDLTASMCQDCDRDGFVSLLWGGEDCDDRDSQVNPDSREICDNGKDDDCDGLDPSCPDCEENWECTDWSECFNGEQSRYCEDLNLCGTTARKPAQIQLCSGNGGEGVTCVDGQMECDGDVLIECFAGQWRVFETCQFGCVDGSCQAGGAIGFITENVESMLAGNIIYNPAFYYSVLVVIIVALAGLIYIRVRLY